MKFPVFKGVHKASYIVASVVLFVFAGVFFLVLLVADVYQSGGYVAVATVAGFFVLNLAGALLFIVLSFSGVTIDATGITLRFGKIKLNKIDWDSVKRVEVVLVKADNSLIINVMAVDKPSYSFRRGLIVNNINKKRITFEYDSMVLDCIMKEYDGCVYGIENSRK